MASLDFSRSVEQDIEIKEDRLFDAVLDFTRDDDVAVDFTSKTIKMDICGGIRKCDILHYLDNVKC